MWLQGDGFIEVVNGIKVETAYLQAQTPHAIYSLLLESAVNRLIEAVQSLLILIAAS